MPRPSYDVEKIVNSLMESRMPSGSTDGIPKGVKLQLVRLGRHAMRRIALKEVEAEVLRAMKEITRGYEARIATLRGVLDMEEVGLLSSIEEERKKALPAESV